MKATYSKPILSVVFLLISSVALYAQFPPNLDLDIIILVDVSGSMEFSLNGRNTSYGAANGPGDPSNPGDHPYPPDLDEPPVGAASSWQRLWYVRQSLPVLGDIIENIPPRVDIRFAFGIFPGQAAPGSLDPVLLARTGGTSPNIHLRDWSQCEFENILGISPSTPSTTCPVPTGNQVTSRWNGTPIGSALWLALNEWAATPPTDPANTDSLIFLLTDGSLHGGASVPAAADLVNVEIASLGIGQAGVHEVDYSLLLSLSSHVRRFEFPTQDEKTLTNSLVGLIFGALGYSTVSDPIFIITAGEVKTFDVQVTKYDKQLHFITTWHEPRDSNKVGFTLQTPSITLTPQNAQTVNGVSYFEGTTYKMYIVESSFLLQNQGSWTLTIDGAPLAPGTKQRTDYLVGGPSSLRVELVEDSPNRIVLTGDKLNYGFRIVANDTVLKDLDTWIKISTPSIAPGNWFAKHKLSPSEIAYVKNLKFPGYVSDTFKKSYYLQNVRGIALPQIKSEIFELSDDRNGVYRIGFEHISFPGLYSSRLLASGDMATGQRFTREFAQTKLVIPKIEANWQKSRLDMELASQTATTKTYEIVYTPKDQFGNFMIPGEAENIKIDVSGEETETDSLIDNLDGTYTQIATVPKVAPRPNVIVSYKALQYPRQPLFDNSLLSSGAFVAKIGNLYLSDQLDIRDALSYRIGLLRNINPRIGIETELGITPSTDSSGSDGVFIQAGAGITFDLATERSVIPYLIAGAGWYTFENFASDDNGGYFNFGSGMRFGLSDRFIFRIEAKDFIISRDGMKHSVLFNTGVSFNFAE